MISGHPISTGFRRLTGCQRDPRDRGVTCNSINSEVIGLINRYEFVK